MGKIFEIDGETVNLTPDQEQALEQAYQEAYQLGLDGKRKPSPVVVMSKYSICYNYQLDIGYEAGLKDGIGRSPIRQSFDRSESSGLTGLKDTSVSNSNTDDGFFFGR